MADLLFKIGDFVVFINFLSLLLFVKAKVKDDSVLWSLAILCILNGLMHGWGYFLKSKFDVYDKEFMRHLWYLSFSAFYVIGAAFLVLIHKYMNVVAGTFSKVVSASFIAITFLTVIRHLTLVTLNLDILFVKYMYSFGIPLVNVIMAICSLFVTIRLILLKRSL
ncbi:MULTISPECIES: hypothetical protein [unclassified Pseudoalteromonas]|uniref:hypothetical protein n=1 Tax=unclassified Pseudoalteromonas TaxID=194690 RepID=UPI001F1CF9E9|nr:MULTISPECIES: hypothetical protein [unclassified Pseudoalteromonas]MCF2827109.1 hypothetical protein [Pseudoalteromonas sp. OF5H-5]MCF2834252.1 hypothetical protein [Pseudoalteromonas sp. DL2-H6]MCF2925878.1 hypothetical protein [Pseudoalteromonas sp. DL2-H1]